MRLLLDAPPGPPPNDVEAILAREEGVPLKRVLGKLSEARLRVELEGSEPDGEAVLLPDTVTRLLLHVFDEMANANAVALVPLHAELTSQQAANMPHASRPLLGG